MKWRIRNNCWLFVWACCLLIPAVAIAGAYEDVLNAVQAKDLDKVSQLLLRGMDVNTSDPAGNTLVMLAARNGDTPMLEFLLKNKPNILKKNKYGDTALLLAAFQGNLSNVKALVEAGADLEADGWTPLIYASFEGRSDVVAYLLTLDVDIDAQSDTGITALMAATRNNHVEVVKLLLDQEADIDLKNQNNQTALDMAIAAGYGDIVALLIVAGQH